MRAAEDLTASPRGADRASGAVSLRARATEAMRAALPQRCSLCAALSGGALVCPVCERALPRVARACPICALPSPDGIACGACLAHAPPFAACVAAFVYAFPVDRLLQALKYGGRLALADWAGDALAAAVAARGPPAVDAIVAMPLAPARQRARGFNQAREIARRVATRLGTPTLAPLVRSGTGPPQAMLPWAARAANVRGAFACAGRVGNLRIAIVDDVMTTGATVAEAARVLRASGAASVEAWVVARTLVDEAQ